MKASSDPQINDVFVTNTGNAQVVDIRNILFKHGSHNYHTKSYVLKCDKGHIFEKPKEKIRYFKECPECAHPKIIDRDSEFAKLFVDQNIPREKTCMSHENAEFWCPVCGYRCKRSIHTVYQRKDVACPKCKKSKSYGERFVASVLKLSKIEYKTEYKHVINGDKYFYDFLLTDSQILIEVNGLQHYEESFSKMGGQNLKEVMYKDALKKENLPVGMRLITIDCRKSEWKFVKKEVIKCLKSITRCDHWTTDQWKKVAELMMQTEDHQIVELYNEGMTCQTIAEHVNLSMNVVSCKIADFRRQGIVGPSAKEKERNTLRLEIIELRKQGLDTHAIAEKLNTSTTRVNALMGEKYTRDSRNVPKLSTREEIENELHKYMNMGNNVTKYNILNMNPKMTMEQKRTVARVFDILYANYSKTKANGIVQNIIENF